MDVLASVEAGDMKYTVAERQADYHQPILEIEEASMSEVIHLQIPINVSNSFTTTSEILWEEQCILQPFCNFVNRSNLCVIYNLATS